MSVQKSDILDLEALVENNDYDISKAEKEEIENIKEQLEEDEKGLRYSNDTIIDMVVKVVRDYTWSDEIKDFLGKVNVENAWVETVARAFPPENELYQSTIGRNFSKILQHVSSVSGTIFIDKLFPKVSLLNYDFYIYYVTSLVQLIDTQGNENNNGGYWKAVRELINIDSILYPHYSDILIFFEREINEMALAFIVGHEIGHQILGHTEGRKECNIIAHHKGFEDEENESWQLEYSADAFGVDFTLHYMMASIELNNPLDFIDDKIYRCIDYRLLGIFIALFSSVCYDNRCLSDSTTHPGMGKRYQMIIQDLKESHVQEDILDSVISDYQHVEKMFKDARYILKVYDCR